MSEWMLTVHDLAAPFLLSQVWPMLWQSSLLIVLVAVSNRTVFRKASAQLRYALWALVLVRLLLPPSLDLPTGIRHWGTGGMERYASSIVTKATAIEPPAMLRPFGAPRVEFEPIYVSEATQQPLTPPVPPAAPQSRWASVVVLLWTAGTTLLLCVLVLRLIRYHRILRHALPPPPWVCDAIVDYKRRMNIRWPVEARVVQDRLSPSLMGVGRLTILLPAPTIATLSEDQLRAVLAHELAHVKRWDFLVNWAQVLLGIVYFYHPLLWFANRQMRVEREHACDDLTLVTLGLNRKAYAESLLRVAETVSLPRRFAPVQLGVVETRSNLARRLRRILDHGLRPAPRLTLVSACIVLGFAAVFGTWRYSFAAPADSKTEALAPVDMLPLEITVVDEAGASVAGVQLKPVGLRTKVGPGSHYGWGYANVPPEMAETDMRGIGVLHYPRYVMEHVETGQVTVAASHPDYAPAKPIDIKVDSTSPAIVLEQGARVRVSGYIADENVRVSPVYAMLSSQALPSTAAWNRSADGTLERRNIETGLHYLWLVHRTEQGDGYFSEPLRFEAEKGISYEYRLPMNQGVRLAGRIDDSVPRPVRHGWAEVRICPQEQLDKNEKTAGLVQWVASVEIGDDGRFEFDGLPKGHAELLAACDGAVSNSNDGTKPNIFGIPEVVSLRGDVDDVAIPMQATSTAIVTVIDSQQRPLLGAEVVFWAGVQMFDYYSTVFGKSVTVSWAQLMTSPEKLEAIWTAQQPAYQAKTDELGKVIIPNLPAWADVFSVTHDAFELPIRDAGYPPGRRDQKIDLRPGEKTNVVAVLEPKGTTVLGDTTVDSPGSTAYVPAVTCPVPGVDPFAMPVEPNTIFSGQVLDEMGKPLEGVRVDAWTWCPGDETDTSKDGTFALEFEVDQRNIEVRFSKAGYSPVYMYYQPVGTLMTPVVMTTKTYFEGVITGSDGKPVADAIIRADAGPRNAEGVFIGDTTTEMRSGADGTYHFPVQHDTYTVTVTAGAESAVLHGVGIAQYEAKRLDIQLQTSPAFRARVVDSVTNKPVAGVRLGNWRFKEIGGVSDANGKITITGIPEGPFEFDVNVEELGIARWWSDDALKEWEREYIEDDGRDWQRNFDGLTFQITPNTPEVTIVVEQGARVLGSVVDPDGNPVAGATVAPALTGTGNSITGDTRFSVETDDTGQFDMLLPASKIREYNLIAHDGKYEEWRQWANGVMDPITTQPGDVFEDVVIHLRPPCIVRGVAVDDTGAPVASREVRATACDKTDNRYYVPTTRTDDEGRFKLQFVAPGTHFIQVAPFWLDPGEAPDGTSQIVETSSDLPVEGVSLVAKEAR